jgi:hypothetical protein
VAASVRQHHGPHRKQAHHENNATNHAMPLFRNALKQHESQHVSGKNTRTTSLRPFPSSKE